MTLTGISEDCFRNKYGLYEAPHPLHKGEVGYNMMLTLIKRHHCKNIFEFGLDYGYGAALMALNTPPDAHIWSLGINKEWFPNIKYSDDNDARNFREVGKVIAEYHVEDKVTEIMCDNAHFDPDSVPKMDFVFIDANHTTEDVIHDTLKAYRMIKRGGVIFWHDIQVDAVKKALDILGERLNIITVDRCNCTYYVHW